MSTGYHPQSGPLFVVELAKQGIISNDVFGFVLTGNPETSYCDVGMLLESSMKVGSEIAWIDVDRENYWWSSDITGIRFAHP
jgi:hypothetical protein